MRVGQKNKLTYRWASKGSRPPAAHDQRTQSTYLFGAVCPEHGTGVAFGFRIAEENQHGVADELVDRPAIGKRDLGATDSPRPQRERLGQIVTPTTDARQDHRARLPDCSALGLAQYRPFQSRTCP